LGKVRVTIWEKKARERGEEGCSQETNVVPTWSREKNLGPRSKTLQQHWEGVKGKGEDLENLGKQEAIKEKKPRPDSQNDRNR